MPRAGVGMIPRQPEGLNPARSCYTNLIYKRERIPAADPVRSNAISMKSSHQAPGFLLVLSHRTLPSAIGTRSEQITDRRMHNCGITRMKFPPWRQPEALSRNYMYFRMYFHCLIPSGTGFP
jgi:hypothetical protein